MSKIQMVSMYGANRDRLIKALNNYESFDTQGAMHAFAYTPAMVNGYIDAGMLKRKPQYKDLIEDSLNEGIMYLVYSYATVIAWVTKAGKVRIPYVTYSATTTKHQKLCRDNLTGWIGEPT